MCGSSVKHARCHPLIGTDAGYVTGTRVYPHCLHHPPPLPMCEETILWCVVNCDHSSIGGIRGNCVETETVVTYAVAVTYYGCGRIAIGGNG